MAPLHLEAGGFLIVGHVLFAIHRTLIAGKERTAVTIALAIVRRSGNTPRALGVNLTNEFQVHLVADGKIVTTIAQIETSGRLITIGWHDETRGIALGEGEEAIRNGKRQGHISHHQIGRSEHHILARAHLSARQGEVEVGVWLVAGGITSVVEEHLALGITLRDFRSHETFVLFGIDILDETLLGLEVKGHGISLVGIVAHLKDRCTKLRTRGIERTRGMHQAGVERHVYLVALQVHVLILHVRLAIEVGNARLALVGHRVLCRIVHRGIDTILTLAIDRIGTQGVVDGFVVYPDGLMQRVHQRSIVLQQGVALQRVKQKGVFAQWFGCNGLGFFNNRVAGSFPLGKAHLWHIRQRKNDDEKQQEKKRLFFHGCKITNNLPNTSLFLEEIREIKGISTLLFEAL